MMILVTGAAGYIGSHTIHMLNDLGKKSIALDNLYSGHKWAIPRDVKLVVADCGNIDVVSDLIIKNKIESIIHFAAHLEVEESTRLPIKYYRNNFINTLNLIETASKLGVKNFIFSSTCAVYGTPEKMPVDEGFARNPISPYGKSKMMIEMLLEDLSKTDNFPMRYVLLRYFNVAGARVVANKINQTRLGQATPRATQLVKVSAEVALGKREKLIVFGTDYPTKDGTCIRDYIHVDDLADAHILALKYLENGGKSDVFNCGYGFGLTVREVVSKMKEISGVDFKVEYTSRRAGDAVAIYAEPSKIMSVLNWKPKYADLEVICKTAFEWERDWESLYHHS
ncbi:MAG: UDP-glucose 4-epimerase GalE [Oligoflexia bacterium]|nr:UDP-glucose 4-epimerase GalE [Oligoflexia bacterium]